MNLIELFDTLFIPKEEKNTYNAIPIPEYNNFRIAIDSIGNPLILLSIFNKTKDISVKNFRLKYLQVEQNVECKISENKTCKFQIFTVITFTSTDRNLQEYFLRIAETLIKTIGASPTQIQVVDSLNKFVEIFRSLSDTPTKTIHGIWTELFLIDSSKNPVNLLNYWHKIPEEKFDFNAGVEKIEVKSNSNFERKHIFTSEQLNPPMGTLVLIASIFIRQNTKGKSIQDLIESIVRKIENNLELENNLNSIVCKTLGNLLEQSIKIKYDYVIAKDSLLFYTHEDISKIEMIHIPENITEVNYKADLTAIENIDLEKLSLAKSLFSSL